MRKDVLWREGVWCVVMHGTFGVTHIPTGLSARIFDYEGRAFGLFVQLAREAPQWGGDARAWREISQPRKSDCEFPGWERVRAIIQEHV
jgi:hypothetical protein